MQQSEQWLSLENLEGEVWRIVKDYPYYEVSNYGRIKRRAHYSKFVDKMGRNRNVFFCERIVRLSSNIKGYKVFRPCRKDRFVHREVAKAFIPNPDNLPHVNHKDENPTNNYVCINPDGSINAEKSNLEWCTPKYNCNYGTCQKRRSETLRRNIRHKCFVVKQYTLGGNLIKEYVGKREIVEAGYSYDAIIHCCKHQTQSAFGYVWRRNDDPFTPIEYHYDTDSCKKVVLCYDLNMNLVAEYFGTKEAVRALGKQDHLSTCISRCCNGGRPTAFGYIWKYKN